jgi:opacity protein-like surface antigen
MFNKKRNQGMIKKVLTAFLAVLPGMAVFGVDIPLNVGGGGLVGGLFTRYTLTAEGNIVVPVDVVSTQEINQVNYGGFLFVDTTWVELDLALQGGSTTWQERYSANTKDGMVLADQPTEGTGTEAMFGLSLLGKYPFRLNRGFSIFPLAGVEYQIALLEYRDPEIGPNYNRTNRTWEKDSNNNAYSLSVWNSLLIDIGAGVDLNLYSRLFLRTELLYGFRLQTPYEIDALEKVKKMANAPDPKLAGLTSGPTLRLALGWRIF